MHLKSLELTGFKSFAEGKVDFPRGVTAVVGPNGAGKSNVVDAILWVLGEQSTKTLRSERMEDVIFNGTQSRKPLGMAEVSLVMSGFADQKLEGIPPLSAPLGEYDEVMITRRLYRNGDSEYLINKTSCRLKDVRSLLLDTRAGTKGHTVIEQGRIEQILNASPQDRRELIEETAGIVRYKKQKAEALRKLDSTHQNLLRVRDIIAEVQRQLTSLERQSRQARAYQNLQQEAKTIEIRLLVGDYRARLGSQVVVERELAGLETVESSQMAEQARLSCELEDVRLRMTAGDQAVGRIRETLTQVERQQAQAVTAAEVERTRLGQYEQQRAQSLEELARLQRERAQAAATMTELRERLSQADAEIGARAAALSELEKTVEALTLRRGTAAEEVELARRDSLDCAMRVTSEESAVVSLEARRDDTVRRANRLAIEQAEIESQRTATYERLQAAIRGREEGERRLCDLRMERERSMQESHRLDEHLRETDHLISRQQEALAADESRLRALQGIIREEMGYGREGAEEATSLRAACHGVREAVAEWLVVPAGFDRAIESVLGERVRAWLVEGPTQAREAIAFLKEKGLGRGAFVPLHPRWSGRSQAGQDQSWWPALQHEPGVLGRALDLVRAADGSPDVLSCLIETVVVVESLDVAIGLWERALWSAPDGPTLVTLDGELLDAAGVITGGTTGETGGLLQRRRETQQLEATRVELTHSLEEHRRIREQLSAESLSVKTAQQRLDRTIRDGEMQLLGLTKDEASLGQNVEEFDRRIETIRTERREAEEERTQIEGDIASVRERLLRLRQEHAVGDARHAELGKALLAMEEDIRAVQQRVMDARLDVATSRSRRERDEADLARLIGEQAEWDVRTGVLERQIAALDEAMQHSRAERDRNEALFQELEGRAGQIRTELDAAQNAQARDAELVRQVERNLTLVRDALVSNREARTAVEIRRAEIKTQLASLESTLAGTYQLDVAEALAAEPALQGQDDQEQGGGSSEEGASQELRDRLRKIRDRIERMGPINLAAIAEHHELEERHRFLTEQEADLANSIGALKEIISRINHTTKQMFLDTFNELQQKFGDVFTRFFPGGRAELILTEPEPGQESDQRAADEPGVDIVAQPPGKRLKSITMLSGG
ncbi:MAG: chromosome segregation protein SMC, partial [Nitrospirae bacterium]